MSNAIDGIGAALSRSSAISGAAMLSLLVGVQVRVGQELRPPQLTPT